MPTNDAPSIIVARFLKSNNYVETYKAFVAEASLPFDAGSIGKGDLTLEKLLDEKKAFDVSSNFEKLGLEDEASTQWSVPAPSLAEHIGGQSVKANILSITPVSGKINDGSVPLECLLVSAADRRLDVVDLSNRTIVSTMTSLQDSPILSCATIFGKYLLTTSMSGQMVVSDFKGHIVEKRRDHSKYVVKVIVDETDENLHIASAGWDGKVLIYKLEKGDNPPTRVGDPVAEIKVPTKPETILFVKHPDTGQRILVLTRTDSSFLYYYSVDGTAQLLGKQNLAPHSNAWVAFTPSAIAQSPVDSTLLAVGLSTLPHMKMAIVRMLLPVNKQLSPFEQDTPAETQASQARRELAVAEREHSAIQILCNTMAPQTAYSTPAIAWRPDGSGIWVNGDDGLIRGIEANSGRVVATLQGHEPASKVRCIWAGTTTAGELLVSGGFDQRLLIWRKPSH